MGLLLGILYGSNNANYNIKNINYVCKINTYDKVVEYVNCICVGIIIFVPVCFLIGIILPIIMLFLIIYTFICYYNSNKKLIYFYLLL